MLLVSTKLRIPLKKSGYRLVGYVYFDNVNEHISAISPVSCGIGLLTVAMLMEIYKYEYWN